MLLYIAWSFAQKGNAMIKVIAVGSGSQVKLDAVRTALDRVDLEGVEVLGEETESKVANQPYGKKAAASANGSAGDFVRKPGEPRYAAS